MGATVFTGQTSYFSLCVDDEILEVKAFALEQLPALVLIVGMDQPQLLFRAIMDHFLNLRHSYRLRSVPCSHPTLNVFSGSHMMLEARRNVQLELLLKFLWCLLNQHQI